MGTKRTAGQIVHRRLVLASTPGGIAVHQSVASSDRLEHFPLAVLCAHFQGPWGLVTQSMPLVE